MQSGRFHEHLHELHQRYGPVVRIAPGELSYIDPRAWKDIYQPHAGHQVIPKGTWIKVPPGEPHSVVTLDEAAHTRNRRALMGAFTEHAILEHAPILESHVSLMMHKFREQATSSQGRVAVVDMAAWLNFLTFDISGALSFGESFDSVKNGKAHPWVEISCSFGKGIALMASVNFFSPLDKLLAYNIPKKVLQKMEYHKQLVHQKFLQRMAMPNKGKSQDYVGSILQYNETKGEVKIPVEELENNMNVLIFAGSETTGTALASIINALLRYPEALQKVVEEIRGAFGSEDQITVSTVGHLEYLTAVIQEGIRLGPPAAVALPRVIPKSGEVICDQWVPGGVSHPWPVHLSLHPTNFPCQTYVSLNQYPAYRSPTNFTHPNSFIPERFTPSNPFPSDNISVFEPFLVGRHKCLGQKLAWAEMRLTLAKLLFCFDIAPVEALGDFGEQRTYIFWEKKPLMVELRERNG